MAPRELKYTKEHDWIKLEGGAALIGITDFAQSSLGELTFLELPAKGRVCRREEELGAIESVKAAETLHAPLSGEILERNEELTAKLETIRTSPYEAWFYKIKIADTSELQELLSAEDYEKLISAH